MENNIFDKLQQTDLVEETTQKLRRAIIQGELAPGTRVVESELARQLGISRAPLREAARRLEQAGLLTSNPRRGFFVRTLDLDELDDIYSLRIALERYACSLAVERATPEDILDLKAQIKVMEDLAEQGDLYHQVEQDLKFHEMLCQISGNKKLVGLFRSIADENRLIIALIGQLFKEPKEMADVHHVLVACLEQGDAERLDKEIHYHIDYAWKQVRIEFENSQKKQS
ncbi:GntR family transcriptional regulator [Rhodovibrionaceae bacterium A322]